MFVKTKSDTLVNLTKADSISLINYNCYANYKIVATFGITEITVGYYDTKEDAVNDLISIENELAEENKILYL